MISNPQLHFTLPYMIYLCPKSYYSDNVFRIKGTKREEEYIFIFLKLNDKSADLYKLTNEISGYLHKGI